MDKRRQTVCESCGLIFEPDDVDVLYPNIPGLLDRMTPGDEVPAGECPACGALVYYLDENTESGE